MEREIRKVSKYYENKKKTYKKIKKVSKLSSFVWI